MSEASSTSAMVSSSSDPQAALKFLKEGRSAEASNDRWKAIEAYRGAFRADPANQETGFRLSYNLDLIGESDEALSVMEHTCGLGLPHINSVINLAILYEDIGDYCKAEKCLKQILETNPNHPRARLYLKDVLASKKLAQRVQSTKPIAVGPAQQGLLDTPITDFELTVRARNCLKKMNIRTLGDLVRTSEAELMSYKNFGETSLQEIRQLLSNRGLRLGQIVDQQHNQMRKEILEQLKSNGKEDLALLSVNDLNLSVRSRNALEMLKIQTLADLCSHTEAELLGIKNFGLTSLTEIKAKLEERGLSLRSLD